MYYSRTLTGIAFPWLAGLWLAAGSDAASGKTCTDAENGGAMDTVVERQGDRVVIRNVPRPHGCNSCLASMAAALRAVGEDITYTYLMGASSRAFRLQFSWCPSAPSAYVGFEVWPAALEAAGYEWEPHLLFDLEEIPTAVRDAVHVSIDAGRPVLFGSEEDGVLVGYEPVSADNPTGWLARPGPVGPPHAPDEPYVRPVKRIPWGVALLQRRTTDRPAPRDQALWALRTAATNAHRGDYKGLTIGLAAWEKWIAELREFERIVAETRADLEAQGRGNEDAATSIQLGNAWCYESLLFARQDAAQYLRSVAAHFPEDAAGHLAEAAAAYDAVHERLTEGAGCFLAIAPYPWMKDTAWTEELREDQAERLRRAYELELVAIAAMARALESLDRDVARDDRSVVIGGFEDMDWGGGFFTREDSYMACLAAVMRRVDPQVTYADVMGLSGAAFKLCVAEPSWCPSAAVSGAAGLEEPERVRSALGLEHGVVELGGEADEKRWSEARAAIVSHIGEGLPLLVMDGEFSLIVGYRDNGDTVVCRTYGSRGGEENKEMPLTELRGMLGPAWFVEALRPRTPPSTSAADHVGALRRAVGLARQERSKSYACGFAAYEAWIRGLEEKDEPEGAELHANAYGYAILLTSRRAAAEYLRRSSGQFAETTAAHLRAAAELYEGIAERLWQNRACVEHPWEQSWTVENRRREADLMRANLADECQAIARIEAALESARRQSVKREGGRVEIEGIRRHRHPLDETRPAAMNHPAGLLLAARQLGLDHSAAWVCGAAGFAFALNVHEEICPSGPTAWGHEATDPLASNIGLQVNRFVAHRDDSDFPDQRQAFFERIKAACEDGRLVIAWETMHPDWYPVVGCEEPSGILFRDVADAVRTVEIERMGEMDIPIVCGLFPSAGPPAPDLETVREALAFAVDHAGGGSRHPGDDDNLWITGLAAYDRWIAALEKDSPKVEGLGQHYNAMCWAECRHYAPLFLEEARVRLGRPDLQVEFEQAIGHYRTVANKLAELSRLAPMDWTRPDEANQRFRDPDRRRQWIDLQKEARDAERQGVEALKELLAGMDG